MVTNTKAIAIINEVIGVVSSFYNRAEALGIRKDLIELVHGDLRTTLD